MRTQILALVLTVAAACLWPARAQVPQRLTYQGSVAVGGVAYEGTGQFKFALVSPDGAQTYWSNDGTGGDGTEPSKGLPLTVSGGHYEVVLGDTSLTNMLPVPATVFTNTDVHLRVWFSDGHTAFQTVDPDVPITAVGYAMVAATVPDGAITGAKLADGAVTGHHIAPGAIGAAQLAPNAALQSLQGSGALVLSDQFNPTNLLEAGFSRLGTIQAESDQWANLSNFGLEPRTNAAGVWANGKLLIWGGVGIRGSLSNGARYDPTTETWTPMASPKPGMQGGLYAGVWTGTEWLLLGGLSQSHRAYHPATDTWRALSSSNAPTADVFRTFAIWSGREAIVWRANGGGRRYNPALDTWTTMSQGLIGATNFNPNSGSCAAAWTGTELFVWGTSTTMGGVGGRYDPSTDQWRQISTTKAPSARYYHSAVCNGKEVIVWGGRRSLNETSLPLADGGIYDLTTDSWRSMNTNGVAGRSEHAAVWTGTEMLVWGGKGVEVTNGISRLAFRNGGARYNPRTDTWQPIATRGMPEARMGAVTAWGNGEFRVWGGASVATTTTYRLVTSLANDGWSYRPDTDAWRPIAAEPSGRTGHSVVWTGRELILWGGIGPQRVTDSATSGFLNSGARYSPSARRWYPISPLNAPSARRHHRAVWTGREMIVWGGEGLLSDGIRVNTLNTGGAYDPVTDSWRALDDAGAPAARSAHSMVWTGSEMLVFGGRTNFFVDTTGRYTLNTGGRYQPQTDSWASLTLKNPPSPRQSHGAVWTGTEMVIWGGVGRLTNSSYGALSDGARYNPVLNLWTPVSARSDLRGPSVLVWADDAVLVWSPSTGALGRYDPVLDRWNTLASGGPRSASAERRGAWTGKEMLAWSVTDGFTGARYSPTSNAWTPMTLIGVPRTLFNSQGAWTGDNLMVVGGIGATTLTNGTYSYSLTKPLYLYRHP